MTARAAERFDAAAFTYATATPIQRIIADRLAARIAAVGIAPNAAVAEFGCGLGYLTEPLLTRLEPRSWLATDIAPAMLAALDGRLRHTALRTARIDAADPRLEPGFDLVCSSMTLQWLEGPAKAVSRWRALVNPGGVLAVATLIEGSFAEWRAALAKVGAPTPGPIFPTLDALNTWFGADATVEVVRLIDAHASGLAFARAARAAGVDAGSDRPLNAATMRRALTEFEAGGASVTYVAALVIETV
jgi:malonyl-CoA O-methyltransferase